MFMVYASSFVVVQTSLYPLSFGWTEYCFALCTFDEELTELVPIESVVFVVSAVRTAHLFTSSFVAHIANPEIIPVQSPFCCATSRTIATP
jgi:hypothetical protein